MIFFLHLNINFFAIKKHRQKQDGDLEKKMNNENWKTNLFLSEKPKYQIAILWNSRAKLYWDFLQLKNMRISSIKKVGSMRIFSPWEI